MLFSGRAAFDESGLSKPVLPPLEEEDGLLWRLRGPTYQDPTYSEMDPLRLQDGDIRAVDGV